MRRSEEIEDDLYRIECFERNLNEKSIPIAHRTIPKTWKLKSLKLTSLIALRAYESCIFVNILQKIEALAFVIVKAAHDINRIEMSG